MIKHLVSMVVGIAGAAILALFPDAALADKRVALVIGNSAYENVSKLPNPARDANAVAQMFKKAGFDTVIMEHDVGNLAFKRAIRKFEDASADADIAVVFYAGHGIEIQGINYLIPVDAKLASDRDARDEAISLERLIDSVESVGKPKRLRLIILDACRDNPFVRNMKRQRQAALRSITAGLGAVEPTGSDTLIAYAAKGGSVAEDGDGSNSPFTTALLKSLTVPGLDIRLAFGRVRDDVMKLTNRKQEPFVYGSLGGGNISLVPAPAQQPVEADATKVKADYELVAQIGSKKAWEVFIGTYKTGFYVDLAKAQLTKLAALEPQIAPSSTAKPSSDEARAWSNIQQSNDPVALQKFIERYPNSPLALNAQNRLSMLERNARDREETARLEREAALKRADDERRGRETAQQRIEDERRLKAAKSERDKAELQASLKREENERRAAADQRRAELQAQVKRAEDDRRAKQAEAERQKAALHAALQPSQSSSSPPSPQATCRLRRPRCRLRRPRCRLRRPRCRLRRPRCRLRRPRCRLRSSRPRCSLLKTPSLLRRRAIRLIWSSQRRSNWPASAATPARRPAATTTPPSSRCGATWCSAAGRRPRWRSPTTSCPSSTIRRRAFARWYAHPVRPSRARPASSPSRPPLRPSPSATKGRTRRPRSARRSRSPPSSSNSNSSSPISRVRLRVRRLARSWALASDVSFLGRK